MKIIAKYRCQLDGRIYDPGDEADYDGAVTPRVAHNFTDADGGPLKAAVGAGGEAGAKGGSKGGSAPSNENVDPEKEKAAKAKELVDKLAKTMSREALTAKLDEMGVTYKATHKNTDLAKLVLRQQGVIE